jgi:hypothetical protein
MHININIVYKLVYITADGKASSIFRSLYTTQEFHLLSANIRIMLCPRRESILEEAYSFLLSFYLGTYPPPHGVNATPFPLSYYFFSLYSRHVFGYISGEEGGLDQNRVLPIRGLQRDVVYLG